jgi:hypothetical protein
MDSAMTECAFTIKKGVSKDQSGICRTYVTCPN